jgi:hypothetical protein
MLKRQSIKDHIYRVTKHANKKWKQAAMDALERIARRQATLTSADVLAELATMKVKTHTLKAIGGVMTAARDQKLIESGGLIRRNDKHTRAVTVLWKSLIYKKPEQAETAVPTPSDQAA